jgi:hypothetical protein
MLQALLKHKLKEAFRDSYFEPSEDSKTSSIFGLLQYLPSQIMWNLLRQSCGDNSSLIEESGELQDIQFWARWSAEGDEISNSSYVEPDVFCEFDKFNLIIEAKKGDNSGQYEQQWKNEISAYLNEYPNNKKKLIFVAFGGNKTLKIGELSVKGQEYIVFSASWQNLLNAIDKYKKECFGVEKRLLSDIILAFEKHNFFCLEWLETLSNEKCISKGSIKIIDFWKFSSIDFFNNFYENCNHNINSNSKNIFALWQTH